MNYLLFMYGDEKAAAAMSKEEMNASMQEYAVYSEAMQNAGVLVGGHALHPTAAATTLRVQNGERITTHGPFAEVKEQIGGYYLINCQNLDEALAWAAQCPPSWTSAIEVRPVCE